jgi:hypothetical protein
MCIGVDPSCSFTQVAASTAGSTSFTMSGLLKGTYYQFKVSAHNDLGQGPDSPAVIIVAADVPN